MCCSEVKWGPSMEDLVLASYNVNNGVGEWKLTIVQKAL